MPFFYLCHLIGMVMVVCQGVIYVRYIEIVAICDRFGS